jgi:Concanavalin A-like lectin/glucanases superfamily
VATPVWSNSFDSGSATSVPSVIGAALVKDATILLVTDGTHKALSLPNESYPASTAYIPVPVSAALFPTGFSMTCWARTTNPPGTGQAIYLLASVNAPDFSVIIQQVSVGPSVIKIQAKNVISSNQTLSPAVWHHYAVTIDSASTKFYIDGALVSNIATGTWFTGNDTQIAIYEDLGANPLLLDDMRIYNVALVAADITHDMNTPSTGDVSGPTVPANSSISDARYIKLNGPSNPKMSNMDLLNLSLTGDIQKYGYGYAIIKNWGTPGVDSVTSARRKHAGATQFESVHDAELRYYKS